MNLLSSHLNEWQDGLESLAKVSRFQTHTSTLQAAVYVKRATQRKRERDTEEGFTEEVRSSNGGEAMRLIPRKGCVAPLLRRQTRAYSHLVGFIHIVHLPNRVETHLSLASLYPTARRQREPDRRNPFCFFTVADNVKSVKKAVTRIEL